MFENLNDVLYANRECWEGKEFTTEDCQQKEEFGFGVVSCKNQTYCPAQLYYGWGKYCKQMIYNHNEVDVQ